MSSSSAIRAGKAVIEFSGNMNPLLASLRSVAPNIASLASGMTSIVVAGVGGAVAAATVAAGSVGFAAKKFADAGGALFDLAGRTGVSVEALSALKFGADQTGASIEDVEKGIRKMQDSLADAAKGGASTNAALSALGLSVSDLQSLKPDQQMERIFAALSRVSDASQRTALAIDLFGRSGTVLLPLAGEFQALRAQAEQLGLVMSSKDAAAADALGDAFGALKASMAGMMNQIGAAVAGPMADIVAAMSQAVAGTSQWVASNRAAIVEFTGGFVQVAKDGYAAVAFAVGNWSDLSMIAGLSVIRGVVSFGNQVAYTFTEVVPAYLTYLWDNWRSIFDNLWRFTKTVTANVFENLRRFGESIADWFVNDEWTFEWKPLTEGFESSLKELPKIAAREITGLEKELGDEIAALSESVGKKWKDVWDKAATPQPTAVGAGPSASPIDALGNAINSASKTTISSLGTFSAGAIGQIAPPEFTSIKDATRETARNTRDMKDDLARIADREGLVFA